MYTLYFDFETVDPELTDKGSCYIWSDDFRILGMGYAIDDSEVKYTKSHTKMALLISQAHTLVAHNATYELGCVKYLQKKLEEKYELDFKYKRVYCTKIGSILDYNIRARHSLDYLGKTILHKSKSQKTLGEYILKAGLIEYPKKYYKTDDKEYKEKTERLYLQKAIKYAYQHLDKVHPAIVEDYCVNDVQLTRELHKYFLDKNERDKYYKENYERFSALSKVTVEMRHKGVRIDIDKAKEAQRYLQDKIEKIEEEAKEKGYWCNYSSPKQVAELLQDHGIELPVSEKGNPSATKSFLEKLDHPIADTILTYRKYSKALHDFIEKPLDWAKDGRIHATMNILGARQTGRFSHTNPNLGQIPGRDKEIGPMARSLFIADEGEKWYHLDYSSQEPRLYVHFAAVCQKARPRYKEEIYDPISKKWVMATEEKIYDCPMIDHLVAKYKEDPATDSHEINRQLIYKTTGQWLERSQVKSFALGEAYAKGYKSTAKALEIPEEKALDFKKSFNSAAPYIKMTSDYAKYLFIQRGYAKTLLGRKNWNDGTSYRAYNYMIQGSAADQTTEALLTIYYKYGIIPTTVVHDEINFSGTYEQALLVKEAMETAVDLEIPSLAEIGEGDSWGEAKG